MQNNIFSSFPNPMEIAALQLEIQSREIQTNPNKSIKLSREQLPSDWND